MIRQIKNKENKTAVYATARSLTALIKRISNITEYQIRKAIRDNTIETIVFGDTVLIDTESFIKSILNKELGL